MGVPPPRRAAAAFNHPNIATIHDVGEPEGVIFIVMELVRGESLRKLLDAGPMEIGFALEIANGVAAGLARARREGVLHRDLKPDNVVLTDDGMPKILDFGLGTLIGDSEPVALDGFWIDTYEVTNREYKAFLDAGGYRDDGFWAEGIDRSAFVDTTGRPGPAAWTLGTYPEGEDELPVGGVSWYEASAFAAWADKSLPTVFHWRLAAQQSVFSEILLWSNVDTKGPAPVGTYLGIGPNGTYDMAGNVREWCVNATNELRHILGGAWSEPDYLYRSTDATDPRDRLPINGFRCLKTPVPLPEAALITIEHPVVDHRGDTGIDDETFALVRQSFDYDDRDLDARIESTDDGERWRHEVVSVRAAYGDERLPIHLYQPKNAGPPCQTVVHFPPSSARHLNNSDNPSFPFGSFIPQSGRVLVYPIYQGTYNRRFDASGPNGYREMTIQIGKDLRRTVDYLETREDVDTERLAHYGLSWGGYLGPTMTAIKPRFAASVLVAGGLYQLPDGWPPAGTPQNFAPRSTVPTLMVNGRKDFNAPFETNIQPLFDMLGTPAEHTRLVLLDGGHVAPGAAMAGRPGNPGSEIARSATGHPIVTSTCSATERIWNSSPKSSRSLTLLWRLS